MSTSTSREAAAIQSEDPYDVYIKMNREIAIRALVNRAIRAEVEWGKAQNENLKLCEEFNERLATTGELHRKVKALEAQLRRAQKKIEVYELDLETAFALRRFRVELRQLLNGTNGTTKTAALRMK